MYNTPALQPDTKATAFVSCSLRHEDKPFVDLIERILLAHQIMPIGTVGLYSAAPENPAQSMRRNIENVDMVVIVATPRYIQRDLQTGSINYGLSEMVHVETGIAYAFGKPVVLFVQEGTFVGNFLPNVTQYIVLNGMQYDLDNKWGLINSLLNNAHTFIEQIKAQRSRSELGNFFKHALAFVGGAFILDSMSEDESPQRNRRKR